jgi:hypothetical protein
VINIKGLLFSVFSSFESQTFKQLVKCEDEKQRLVCLFEEQRLVCLLQELEAQDNHDATVHVSDLLLSSVAERGAPVVSLTWVAYRTLH